MDPRSSSGTPGSAAGSAGLDEDAASVETFPPSTLKLDSAARNPRQNLPRLLSRFVGREQEIAELVLKMAKENGT